MERKELEKIMIMVQEEEKQREIEEKIVEAMQEAEGWPQEHRVSVCIDSDGTVWTTGSLPQSDCTEAQFTGSSYTICSCESWAVGRSGYDYNFSDSIGNQDEYDEIISAYRKENELDDHEEFCVLNMYDFVSHKYPEVIERMDSEHRDWLISELPERASEKYDRFVENLAEVISADVINWGY